MNLNCLSLYGWVASLSLAGPAGAAGAESQTVRVDLRLRTGGIVSGLVVDHDDHALVIVREGTPYVFSWREMELSSALAARKAAVSVSLRGHQELSADDHFALGQLALNHDRTDVAALEFRKAEKLEKDLAPRIREAFSVYRQAKATATDDLIEDWEPDEVQAEDDSSSADRRAQPDLPTLASEDVRVQLFDAYHRFGAKVQEVLGKDVVPLESEHFLIWTDWEPKLRDRLAAWCEAMYAALCERFEVGRGELIFPAKCPVFCFRSKARFRKFARHFDGYDGVSALGYTRSIERHGHVHVALLRAGKTAADFDQFACTLVHEGTHAFLHRLFEHRLIPHWINEGYAELTSERVLGDRCDAGETAALLARQYARYDWSLNGLFERTSEIDVHEYPLAHSIVAYLEDFGRSKGARFIRALKEGRTAASALADAYDGLTPAQLEAAWRLANRLPRVESAVPPRATE